MIGVDVGGTFTDVFVLDEAAGTARVAKVPTTRPDQSGGFLDGIGAAGRTISAPSARSCTARPSAPTRCWNARARGSGSSPPQGFRDVLEMRRRDRPPHLGPARRFRPRRAARPAARSARARAGRRHRPTRRSIWTRCARRRERCSTPGCEAVACSSSMATPTATNEAAAVAAVRARLAQRPCLRLHRNPARNPRVRALLDRRAERLSAARGLGLSRPTGDRAEGRRVRRRVPDRAVQRRRDGGGHRLQAAGAHRAVAARPPA